MRDSFIVKQYDFDNDIAGEYIFAYNTFDDDDNVVFQTVHANLSRTGLTVPDWEYTFPVIINDSIGAVQIKSNQNIGRFGKYYVYNAYIDTEGYLYYGTTSGIITAPFKYSEEYGTYGFFSGTAYNVNTGSGIESGEFLSMILQVFKTNSPSQSNYVSELFWIANPFLMQVPEGEDESVTEAKVSGINHLDAKAMKRVSKPFTVR